MQMPIIDKEEKAFRDPYIFASDVKAITIDNVLVNLFMLIPPNRDFFFLPLPFSGRLFSCLR